MSLSKSREEIIGKCIIWLGENGNSSMKKLASDILNNASIIYKDMKLQETQEEIIGGWMIFLEERGNILQSTIAFGINENAYIWYEEMQSEKGEQCERD